MQKKLVLILFFVLGLIVVLHAQPNAPKNLKAAVDTTGQFYSVKLTWDSVTVAGSTSRTLYVVYKKSGTAAENRRYIRQSFKLDRNSYVDRFVSLGKTYSYFVTAIDSSRQESKHSDTASVTLPAAPALASISGMLKDSTTGIPIKNGRVAAVPVRGFHFVEAKTDSTGHYLARVAPGTYILEFQAPRYRSVFYNNAHQIGGAAKIAVRSGDSLLNYNASLLAIGPEKSVKVSGTVTDSAGKPLQARVRLLVLHHRFYEQNFKNVLTDSAGHYSISARQGDSVIVHVQPLNNQYLPQFYNNKQELAEADKILLNGDSTNINFTLVARPVYANKISGQIFKLDSTGTTSSVAASVTAYRLHDKTTGKFFKTSVMTDSVGNYSISNLIPGKYILLAVPVDGYLPTFYRADTVQTVNWRQADSLVVTETSLISNINFVVRPVPDSGFGTIAGTIKDNSGAGVNGAIVYFTDENQIITGYTFSDAKGNYSMPFLAPGIYTVWVDKVNYSGSSLAEIPVDYSGGQSQPVNLTLTPVVVTAVNDKNTVIQDYELTQNYPNPFNPTTQISFQMPTAGIVTLKVYNSIGQEVMTLVNGFKPAGKYTVTFNARNLSSGVYLYRLNSGNFELSHKMILLK